MFPAALRFDRAADGAMQLLLIVRQEVRQVGVFGDPPSSELPTETFRLRKLVVQADGKIVTLDPPQPRMRGCTLNRYTADASPDTKFGGGRSVDIGDLSRNGHDYEVSLQADGGIVVAVGFSTIRPPMGIGWFTVMGTASMFLPTTTARTTSTTRLAVSSIPTTPRAMAWATGYGASATSWKA